MAIERLKVGIIGGGFMGRVHTNAARTAGGDVVAISSSSLASAERAAAEFSIGHAYANSDELLADPNIDVVHICTPNSTHASLALAALLAGKHVICEKPLATTSAEAQALVEAAAKSGKVAAVPFIYRYHPMVREARARVAAGPGPARGCGRRRDVAPVASAEADGSGVVAEVPGRLPGQRGQAQGARVVSDLSAALFRLRRVERALTELTRSGLGRPERDRLEGKCDGMRAAIRVVEDLEREEA